MSISRFRSRVEQRRGICYNNISVALNAYIHMDNNDSEIKKLYYKI